MNKKAKLALVSALFIIGILTVGYVAAASSESKLFSPTNCNNNQQWEKCPYAFSEKDDRAMAKVPSNVQKTATWSNYPVSLPNSATINKVFVRADFFSNSGKGFIDISVSSDNGITFGPVHTIGGNINKKTFLIDVTSETTWTEAKLKNAVVKATCFKRDIKSTSEKAVCKLVWIPLKVEFTKSTEPAPTPACDDGIDNDNDGNIDFTSSNITGDSKCSSLNDNDESPRDSCGDTDLGGDISTKGTISGDDESVPFSYTDFCTDTTHIKEYYCGTKFEDYAPLNYINICPPGTSTCSNGACVP